MRLPCPDRLSTFIWTRRWCVLPPVLWMLIASPLLEWANSGVDSPRWFAWPVGARSWWRWED